MQAKILITFLIAALLISCEPLNAPTIIEPTIMLEATFSPSPIISTPINVQTQTVTPTLAPLPTPPPTNTQIPFFFSYSYTSDGGDDLWRCMENNFGNPSLILYQDGVLIQAGYPYFLQSQLSPTQINRLMDEIAQTGLPQQSESKYQEGNGVFIFNGRYFHQPFNLPSKDPLSKAISVTQSFTSENTTRFVPKDLTLFIYSTTEINNVINSWYWSSKSNSELQNWQDSPLFQYGEGWFLITGEDVLKVMDQFSGFPDFRVYQNIEAKRYYVAVICTNYPYR